MTRMSTARFEGDTWDLTSGVGATATMVAAARAVATRSPNALINDQFAAPLVHAVGVDYFIKMADGELYPHDVDDKVAKSLQRWADAMAIRTEYFDAFFVGARGAMTAGIRQAVILASGLDSRAYRLPWPAATAVFEVDQQQVIDFKTATLTNLGAQPTADRIAVAIDLRDDWPTALIRAGFDPTQPAAWIAEGLLGYLSAEAQDALLDQITALSAPGSRLGTEDLLHINAANEAEVRGRMQREADQWSKCGFELDVSTLVYFDDRTTVATYLADHGWETLSTSTTDLLAKHGWPPVDPDDAPFGDVVYLSAAFKGH
jgi:methyltransferase (TIGR00027 family)